MGRLIFLKHRNNPFDRGKKEEPKEPVLTRNEQIVSMREDGKTFQAIAGEFGISTARVQQICKKEKQNG